MKHFSVDSLPHVLDGCLVCGQRPHEDSTTGAPTASVAGPCNGSPPRGETLFVVVRLVCVVVALCTFEVEIASTLESSPANHGSAVSLGVSSSPDMLKHCGPATIFRQPSSLRPASPPPSTPGLLMGKPTFAATVVSDGAEADGPVRGAAPQSSFVVRSSPTLGSDPPPRVLSAASCWSGCWLGGPAADAHWRRCEQCCIQLLRMSTAIRRV